MFEIKEGPKTDHTHTLLGTGEGKEISWGHGHSLCDSQCPCWPECKPKDRLKNAELRRRLERKGA